MCRRRLWAKRGKQAKVNECLPQDMMKEAGWMKRNRGPLDTLREQLRWAAEAHETKAPVEELQSKEMKTAKRCLKVETLPAPEGKRNRSTET